QTDQMLRAHFGMMLRRAGALGAREARTQGAARAALLTRPRTPHRAAQCSRTTQGFIPKGALSKTRQMMSDLRTPRRPVVRRILAPDVELVPDALLGEERGEAVRLLERPGRVLPRTPADDEQQADLRAQPVQMVAAETGDVVGRVVEVDGVAAFAPADGRDVVDVRQAEGQREEVAAAEGEVGGVEGAERDT